MERFLREIECFKVMPRKKILKGGKGNYKGQGFGNSLDFYGHREYILGDDIRKIDWKAYMRTEKFYIKEFTEERQMHVNVILDNSASMDIDNNKWIVAKKIALGISYLTLKQSDNLSFYTINDKLKSIQKNVRGKEYFYELIELISKIKAEGITNFYKATHLENNMDGITFIISDFFGEKIEKVLDFLCSKGQEVVCIHILAPSEINPDYEEELKLIDIETGNIRRIQFNNKVKEVYMKKIKSFIEDIKNNCSLRESRYILAPTDIYPSKIMMKVLGGF